MPRDYKHRRKRRAGSSGSSGPFVSGLALGLAIALLVHLYHRGQDRAARPETPPPKRSAVTTPQVPEERGFDFYDILPEFEVVIPAEVPPPSPSSEGAGEGSARAYYVQAGSFRRFDDADRRKASLALLGIVSEIRKAEVEGRTTHRVLIGPISEPSRLQALRRQLSENGIEYLMLQAKEPSA